jgi:16S rRNA (guanine527-N7)-methyltransferase
MFHVKHRREPLPEAADAAAIADDAIAIAGQWLISAAIGVPEREFLARMRVFALRLAQWGAVFNLTAEATNPQEIAFHIIDSLSPLTSDAGRKPPEPLLAHGTRVLDLGSGAGFPGLILAAASDASFTLAESRRKRANFLSTVAAEMALFNVSIEAGRYEPGAVLGGFEVATARGFARPSLVYESAGPSLVPAGSLILFANPGQDLHVEAAQVAGFGPPSLISYEIPRGSARVSRRLAIFRKILGK